MINWLILTYGVFKILDNVHLIMSYPSFDNVVSSHNATSGLATSLPVDSDILKSGSVPIGLRTTMLEIRTKLLYMERYLGGGKKKLSNGKGERGAI